MSAEYNGFIRETDYFHHIFRNIYSLRQKVVMVTNIDTHTKMPFVPVFFQYVLNDKVSYPEETFMDWEFKISVMYDIAKVRQTCSVLLVNNIM